MKWRYQAVIEDDGSCCVSMIEVYFDKHGRLEAWTAETCCYPSGDTSEELSRDLIQMLADTLKWLPVRYADLHVGMTFECTGVDVEKMIEAMMNARGTTQ